MREYPWERVLEELNNHGCVIGDPVNNRIPVSRAGDLEVTNLPSRATCPNGLTILVLRPALQALRINVAAFIRELER